MNNPREGERARKVEQALTLRALGLTYREIASELNISRSYAQGLVSDPSREIERKRKDSYRGTCKDCGGRTDGSGGRANAPEYCVHCASWRLRGKWTREAIIDAIQRYAATNGHPPKADDWIRGDLENGYPPRSSVYDSNNGRKRRGRFDSWADAIEAAGFPRPYKGIRYNGHQQEVIQVAHTGERSYLVFTVGGDGDYEFQDVVVASSGETAIRSFTDEQQGHFATCPEAGLTHYEFVTEPSLKRMAVR